MDIRTKLKIELSPDKIDLKSSIVTIGSCFAQSIHSALNNDKFNVFHNPFGTTYNPVSISQLLKASINNIKLDKSLFAVRDSRSVHFQYHSDFNGLNPVELENLYDQYNNALNGQLVKSNWLIITFGTASVFRYSQNNHVVANCHKQPAHLFERTMLSENQIVKELTQCFDSILNLNRTIRIILTVSPVRHVRDSLIANSLSKARLLSACHELSSSYSAIDYFPSYEIMVDDLRDYRYYKKDLIHPNETALDYIYDLFKQRYFESEVYNILGEIQKIRRGIDHRPFNPMSKKYHEFLLGLINKCVSLEKNTELDFTEEKAKLSTMIKDLNA